MIVLCILSGIPQSSQIRFLFVHMKDILTFEPLDGSEWYRFTSEVAILILVQVFIFFPKG